MKTVDIYINNSDSTKERSEMGISNNPLIQSETIIRGYQPYYFRHHIVDEEGNPIDVSYSYNFELYIGETKYPSSRLIKAGDASLDNWHDPSSGKISLYVDLDTNTIDNFLGSETKKQAHCVLFGRRNQYKSVLANYNIDIYNVIAIPDEKIQLPAEVADLPLLAFSYRYISNLNSGAVIQVQRDSDSEFLDLTPSEIFDGTLDLFSLGTNSKVTRLYNLGDVSESGVSYVEAGYDLYIYSSGQINLRSGLPVADATGIGANTQWNYDGGLSALESAIDSSTVTDIYAVAVAQKQSNTNGSILRCNDTLAPSSDAHHPKGAASGEWEEHGFTDTKVSVSGPFPSTSLYLYSIHMNGILNLKLKEIEGIDYGTIYNQAHSFGTSFEGNIGEGYEGNIFEVLVWKNENVPVFKSQLLSVLEDYYSEIKDSSSSSSTSSANSSSSSLDDSNSSSSSNSSSLNSSVSSSNSSLSSISSSSSSSSSLSSINSSSSSSSLGESI